GNEGRALDETGQPRKIPGDTLVSMNFWGFQPSFFDDLKSGFARFLEANGASQTAEYYLPAAVQESMRARGSRVKVLPSSDPWCGVTHKHDKTPVESMLRRLAAAGEYPANLWV